MAVASMHIWAFNSDSVKKVAKAIDASYKPDLPNSPDPKEPNGQISYAEVVWAKKEIEKMKRGEGSAFCDQVPREEREQFVKDFDQLVAFFDEPMKHLEMVRRAPLIIGGKQYDDVYEVDYKAHRERDLSTMLRSGYDVIAVRASKKKIYVALNHQGPLKRVARGANGVLKTPYFDPVQVIFAEDQNNGFWEGVSLIPRGILQLFSDIFSRGKNRFEDVQAIENVDRPVKDFVSNANPTAAALANQQSNAPGIVLAVAVGLGAVNLTTLVAQAPEAGIVVGALATVGTIYNAIFGRFFRRQDPYFVLNFAGIQLADRKLVSDLS